jgi:hypothetical protein
MARLAQRRDVAGGNETAVRGQVTTVNDGMRWPRGRRLTVALPLDGVGELHRQPSKLHVRTTAKSRILDRLTASSEQAIHRSRVGTSQIRRESTRTMQPGRSGDYRHYRRVGGTHAGRPSTNIDRRASDVLDHARVGEPTRTESCSASRTSGGRSASTPHMSPRARSVWVTFAFASWRADQSVRTRRFTLTLMCGRAVDGTSKHRRHDVGAGRD